MGKINIKIEKISAKIKTNDSSFNLYKLNDKKYIKNDRERNNLRCQIIFNWCFKKLFGIAHPWVDPTRNRLSRIFPLSRKSHLQKMAKHKNNYKNYLVINNIVKNKIDYNYIRMIKCFQAAVKLIYSQASFYLERIPKILVHERRKNDAPKHRTDGLKFRTVLFRMIGINNKQSV